MAFHDSSSLKPIFQMSESLFKSLI